MRLLELQLLAFGPFTDQVLDLSSPGLQLIYGDNAAGKSTALRAISGLLYGIPADTTDDHVHDRTKLRIGGRVECRHGEVLELVRRKGNKNTLLDTAGAPLADALLDKALAGVGRAQFQRMFALDHASLRAGGEALLRGEGNVGESLFDAGGAHGAGEVLRGLREEADSLFKSAGKNPPLNQAIAELKHIKRGVEENVTSASAYEDQRVALAEAGRELAELEAHRHELSVQKNRLTRLLSILPSVAKHKRLSHDLEAIGDVARLPSDAPEKRNAALLALERSKHQIIRLEREIATREAEAQRSAIELDDALAAVHEAKMKELEQRLGVHRRALADLPKLQGELAARTDSAEHVLKALGRGGTLADVETLGVDRPFAARLDELIDAHTRHHLALESAAESSRDLGGKISALRERQRALAESCDPSLLRAALKRAVASGDLDRAVEAASSAHAYAEAALTQAAAALGFAGQVPAALALAVPARETVDAFVARSDDAARVMSELERKSAEIEASSGAIEEGLRTLAEAGDVPTEAQLDDARGRRAASWEPLREALGRGCKADTSDYESALDETDRVADRLRREADRVARRAQLVAQREANARAREVHQRGLAEHVAGRTTLDAEWRDVWTALGVVVRSPREMLAWLERHAQLLELGTRRARAAQELETVSRERARCRSAIRAELSSLGQTALEGEAIGPLLDGAEAAAMRLEDRLRERRGVAEDLDALLQASAEAERELGIRAEAMKAWQGEWARAMQRIGLGPSASVAQARAVLDGLRELEGRLSQMEEMRRRVQGIERDAAQFAVEVRELVARYARDLGEGATEPLAEELLARWERARHARETFERIAREIAESRQELETEKAEFTEAQLALAALMRDARVGDVVALERAEQMSARLAELDKSVREVEDELLTRGQGASIEELIASVSGADASALSAEQDAIEERLEEIQDDIDQRRQSIGRMQAGVEHFEKRPGAFALKLDEQVCLSRIRSLAERYLRARVAGLLLEREVERYRQQNQDPILARARLLFPRLCLGELVDLEVGFDAKDRPEILSVRAGEEKRVGVKGLSEGTRDQLYLALTLASFERHAERGETMPVVLDDILITSDDDRARAALEVVSEICGAAQILFFTHHARVVDLARQAIAPDKLTVHHLPSPRAAKRAG